MSSGPLNVEWQLQKQDLWCWATVSSMIALFYDNGCGWEQCAVVNAELGRNDCCINGKNCNRTWDLDKALERVGHFHKFDPHPKGLAEIDTLINNNTPLGVVVDWTGGGAHAIALAGHHTQPDGTEMVVVKDSINGQGDVPYNALMQGWYCGTGTWTRSYETKA